MAHITKIGIVSSWRTPPIEAMRRDDRAFRQVAAFFCGMPGTNRRFRDSARRRSQRGDFGACPTVRAGDFPNRVEGEDDPHETLAALIGECDPITCRLDVVELERRFFSEALDPVFLQCGLADENLLSAATAFKTR